MISLYKGSTVWSREVSERTETRRFLSILVDCKKRRKNTRDDELTWLNSFKIFILLLWNLNVKIVFNRLLIKMNPLSHIQTIFLISIRIVIY